MTPVDNLDIPPIEGRVGSPPGGSDNVVDLLRELVDQGTHLADQQLRLIKAEMRESASDLKVAIGGIVGAAVVGIAGLGVLLMGLAYLLAGAIDDLGLATVIVGAVTLLLAFILYRSAASKMAATELAPDRTQRTLQRTPDAVRGNL
jgi:predicted lipid-binding transport protein (Tim44 family)